MSQTSRQWSTSPRQVITVVLLFIVLFFVAGLVNTGLKLHTLQQRYGALIDKREALTQEINDLNGQIRYMQTESYIEKAALTMLLWVRPGEKLIITLDEKPAVAPTPLPQRRP